jgi:hypothetical protein
MGGDRAQIGDDPPLKESARLALAEAILSVASEDSRDAQVLKTAGLQVMALNYRTLMIVQMAETVADRIGGPTSL